MEVLPQQGKGHEVRNMNLRAAGLMAAITWYKDTCKRQKCPVLPVGRIYHCEQNAACRNGVSDGHC